MFLFHIHFNIAKLYVVKNVFKVLLLIDIQREREFIKYYNIIVAEVTALHANSKEFRFRSRVAPRRLNESVTLPCCRITAKIDDDMVRYYSDEDLFLLEVSHSRINPDNERNPNNPGSPSDPGDPNDPSAGYDVTLIKLPSPPPHLPHSPLANSTHAHVHVHDNSNTWSRTDKKRLGEYATQA